uniref:Uncharacterized protein n=1 Tax=Globisporangium ultimum (strain ATCC 200006 / CBS 805.95 / DAOM BR144) TaxID=431595 RepID=K3X8B1_GLOUD
MRETEVPVFRMFNVSKYRIGQLTSDEAIMLFRTVATGIWQLFNALAPSSVPSAIPPQQNVHENLTRTVFGDDEVLSEDAFVLICAANRDIQELLTSLSTAMSCSFKDE